MKRVVLPELLDALPPSDPRAAGSRRDLRRINWWMRNASLLADPLKQLKPDAAQKIFEIGAGDGTLLLAVARKTQGCLSNVHATLLDQQSLSSPQTAAEFRDLGWTVEARSADITQWDFAQAKNSIIIANLFLHHFEDSVLEKILAGISEHARAFIAVEPRRHGCPRAVLPLLHLIGCNSVTRYDAVASIRAGFAGQEISAIWPGKDCWRLTEQRAGLFSHRFIAIRRS